MQQSFGILSKFMQERNNYLRRSLENLQQSSKKVDKSLASTSKPETIQKTSGILGKFIQERDIQNYIKKLVTDFIKLLIKVSIKYFIKTLIKVFI